MNGMTFTINEPTLMHNGHTRSCKCGCRDGDRRQLLNAADQVRASEVERQEEAPDWLAPGPPVLNDAEIDAETVRMMRAGEDWQAIVAEDRRRRGLDDPPRPVAANQRTDDASDPDDWIAAMMRAGQW